MKYQYMIFDTEKENEYVICLRCEDDYKPIVYINYENRKQVNDIAVKLVEIWQEYVQITDDGLVGPKIESKLTVGSDIEDVFRQLCEKCK